MENDINDIADYIVVISFPKSFNLLKSLTTSGLKGVCVLKVCIQAT